MTSPASGASRRPEEFESAAKRLNLQGFHLRDCSLCGYPITYQFGPEGVSLDTGCDCVSYGPVIWPSSWRDIADHYNAQTNAEYIGKMDAFFGFSSESLCRLAHFSGENA